MCIHRISLLTLALGLVRLVCGDPDFLDSLRPVGQNSDRLARMRASLVKRGFLTSQAESEEGSNNVRFALGHSLDFDRQSGEAAATTTAQALLVPASNDTLPLSYWTNANKILAAAGASTPQPPANVINPNAPATPPPPLPWQTVMDDPSQPVDTKLGGAIMYSLSSKPTGTPPPTQARVDAQFIAQCPMVLFESNLTITAAHCNETMGQWIDPNPLNTRTVLRWEPADLSGITFGVDSALTGPGSALFALIKQLVTWTGYRFSLANCLGIERWEIQEEVFKIDSMGNVDSTNEVSDIASNGNQYFLKYHIYSPVGALAATSNLFRVGANQVNFTRVVNGYSDGVLIAVAKRIGNWDGKGWLECTAANSPRAWGLTFPDNSATHPTVATVQDIRVALATAVTLMAYRDENRAKDGLNRQGASREWLVFYSGIGLFCIAGLFCTNCCLVILSSGIKDKLKKTLYDTEKAVLPKRPLQHHAPPLHSTW
mmetsp:Transcript_53977/g.84007  ORF Transcript_53977/g.84007 Transcript_53977/m.84007 type:complete len:486 (-) Transcript_53977:41-1498(-)